NQSGGGGGGFFRPSVVQQISAVQNTAAVTLPNTPTPRNMLVCVASHWTNVSTIAPGWQTLLNRNGAVTDGNIILTKIVNGNDGASMTPFSVSGGCCITVFE